jgi:hypothetical protein
VFHTAHHAHPLSVACQVRAHYRLLSHHIALARLLLADLLADLGMPLEGDALALALGQLDAQRTGTVSFGQFLLWWRE